AGQVGQPSAELLGLRPTIGHERRSTLADEARLPIVDAGGHGGSAWRVGRSSDSSTRRNWYRSLSSRFRPSGAATYTASADARSSPVCTSRICPLVLSKRLRDSLIHPSARIGCPIATGFLKSTDSRAVRPQLSCPTNAQAITSSRIA